MSPGAPAIQRFSDSARRRVPPDRLRQSDIHRRAGAEAEFVGGARDLELAPRLAVRLARVPDDLAAEAALLGDDAREVADGDLLAASQVHGVGLVVRLGRGDDAG